MNAISLSPIFSQIVDPVALAILTGLATWATAMVRNWLITRAKFLDAATDATLAAGVNRGLQNGVAIAMNTLDQYEGEHSEVAVKSWIAAKAGQYAADHSAQALQRFTSLTPDALAEKALAYLPPIKLTGDARVATYVFPPTPKGTTPAQEPAITDGLNALSAGEAMSTAKPA